MRADFRCLSSAEGERYVWEQQLEGTPFERHLRRSEVEIGLRPAGGGTEVSLAASADAARHVAARLADDAPRPGRDPRRGARRDRAGADVSEPRRDSKWWGWGDPAVAPELDAEALATLRERVGELEPSPQAPRRSTSFELPAGRAAAAGADRGGRRGERLHRDRGPGPPRDRLRLRRPGTAAQRPARCRARRRRAARRRRRRAPGPGRLRRRGRRRRPLRRRHQRGRRGRAAARRRTAAWSASTSAACAASRSTAARSPPGSAPACAGPRPKRRSAPQGLVLGHLPAVLRVRDDRRLRRDPLGRTGLERLRPLRLPGQLGPPARPGGRAAHAGDPAHRRRPGPARAGHRLGGRARRHPRGDRAGPPGAARRAATRPGSPRASRPARRSSARWPRAPACPT